MADNSLKVSQSNTVVGLGTWTYNILAAGLHRVRVRCNEIPPSGVIVTINLNGSPVSPTPTAAPSSAQSHIEAQALINCAVSDVITVVLSSSGDTALNTVKTQITIYKGM